jgi:hypothetical protein
MSGICRIEIRTSFYNSDIQPCFGQNLRGHTASGT